MYCRVKLAKFHGTREKFMTQKIEKESMMNMTSRIKKTSKIKNRLMNTILLGGEEERLVRLYKDGRIQQCLP